MKKQTAVEFLFKQIYGDTGHIGSFTTEGKDAYEAFQQAIEMEREQIIDAHLTGLIHPLEKEATKQATEYYTETYKGGEQ